MSIIWQDPVHPWTPSRSPVLPTALLDPGTATGEREVSFELESAGGYRRTVTGTIAYLDEEAQTYMARASDGGLLRVPLRDIKRTSGSAA